VMQTGRHWTGRGEDGKKRVECILRGVHGIVKEKERDFGKGGKGGKRFFRSSNGKKRREGSECQLLKKKFNQRGKGREGEGTI